MKWAISCSREYPQLICNCYLIQGAASWLMEYRPGRIPKTSGAKVLEIGQANKRHAGLYASTAIRDFKLV